ncbi:MAG: hypothetical protein IJW46_05470 [Clostridia bacterium]|nr:hypothetical protein [Clostridia bacterium]
MRWFRSRAVKELDAIIFEIDVNLQNNYKSTAHEARKKLGERVEALWQAGKLREKDYFYYHARYETYTQVMKDYHH